MRLDMSDPRENISRLLQELPARPQAAAEIWPLVYDELRALARANMQRERPGHTLRATALVHEAYVRLGDAANPRWNGKAHFFRAAADAMRRILIDHARARAAIKRGGGGQRRMTSVETIQLGMDSDPLEILALDEAMERLRSEDPRAAEVVRLRYYAGISFAEIADLLDCSERTILREWTFARARLVELIEAHAQEPGA
ncbi:MAG TPA: ECF-type sigma factor [Phycisphaerales bacterium]|nr:ECF-type sigma factor [Phycisphaerales bacterium]